MEKKLRTTDWVGGGMLLASIGLELLAAAVKSIEILSALIMLTAIVFFFVGARIFLEPVIANMTGRAPYDD